MVMHKRMAWLMLLVIATASVSLIIATRHGRGEVSVQAPERTRIKVLRRKDRLHLKPTAQEIQDDQPPPQERFFEDKIPKHLPIKVKLKKEKEKAFKDTKNDKWARDLELEVKNTGTRPIYYLVLLVLLPELRIGQSHLFFDMRFGERKFANFAAGAKPEDVSLKPGETTVLKIKGGNDLDWEDFSRGMLWPRPMRFELEFQELSFGDGTGFLSGGTPWPPPIPKPGEGACLQVPNKKPIQAHHARMPNKGDDSGAAEPESFSTAALQEQTSQEERALEYLIPANVPIRIRIPTEKEREFKDLTNERWARDFELEVTNTADKPIYYLFLSLTTDVIAVEGYRVAFTITYGRTELGDIAVKAEPDDIVIKPGETILLKFHPGNLEGYSIRQRETNRPHPRNIKLRFQWLSFGDGTGFGPGGIALPRKL